jgi:hypothetical protein
METSRVILILVSIILGLYLFSLYGTKEYYGGKIKNIKKIPFNDCVAIAKTYYDACRKSSRGEDAGQCEQRFGPKGTMVQECYYSNYQRM